MSKKIALSGLILAALWPAAALAQVDVPTVTPLPSAVAEGAAAAILGLFGLGLGLSLVFVVILGIVGLVWVAIWIWALVDLLTRKFEGNQQTIWLILMVLAIIIPFIPFIKTLAIVTWLIPILYLIIGRPKGQKK